MLAPFPYFGGKRKVIDLVWQRFGSLLQYTEPFCGSAAMLLGAPRTHSLEVIGDANGFIANFWRAVSAQPAEVARWADYPVSHVDLSARHHWLLERRAELAAGLLDADWPGDAKTAGWWLWGQCAWIGSGWCDWERETPLPEGIGQIPFVGHPGRGVQVQNNNEIPLATIARLGDRLRRVRVIHGGWDRCLNTHHAKHSGAFAGIFLDPPYVAYEGLYGAQQPVAQAVAEWCRKHGGDSHLRIALCGHVGDYELPGWDAVQWSRGSHTMGSSKTTTKECIWFSPNCLRPVQSTLWDVAS